MAKSALSSLDSARRARVVSTLTRSRLNKYLQAAKGNEQQALRLYIMNAKLSAAFLFDFHYFEIALRNKFDAELAATFGTEWFSDESLLALLDKRFRDALRKAQNDAGRTFPQGRPMPPSKVVAELTFGFWTGLTDSRYEHKLWVPCLHKAFSPAKPPKRASFNVLLERLRQVRNRVAHHEPVFQLDMLNVHRGLSDGARLLCPAVANLMNRTSTVKRVAMSLMRYRARRSI
ncbi:Abi family protein [Trinickia sp. EG282A]|uniref:Abi family protein n=1 Tax=Trinickia sp. EG282A TaxID=3237013 RepID=UPI0034D1FBCB